MFYLIKRIILPFCLLPVWSSEIMNQPLHYKVDQFLPDNRGDIQKMDMGDGDSQDTDLPFEEDKTSTQRGPGSFVYNFLAQNVSDLFLENFHNPCWMDKEANKLHCLPYCYLIDLSGHAPSLYKSIISHPLIFDAKLKSPAFWYSQRYQQGSNNLEYYTSQFDAAITQLELCINSTAETHSGEETFHPGIILDPNPDNFFFNYAAQNNIIQFRKGRMLLDGMNSSPTILHRLHRTARFIVIVHNPVERLYKVYSEVFRNPSAEDFHRKVLAAIEWYIDCKETKGPDSEWCVFNVQTQDGPMTQFITEMQKGFYYRSLAKWLEHYGDHSFKFIKYEDFLADKTYYFGSTFRFLKVKPILDLENLVMHHKEEVMYMEPMLNVSKHLLHSLYQPFNDEFTEFMDDNSYRYADRAGCTQKIEKLFALV